MHEDTDKLQHLQAGEVPGEDMTSMVSSNMSMVTFPHLLYIKYPNEKCTGHVFKSVDTT
jgi:hypothetical protein